MFPCPLSFILKTESGNQDLKEASAGPVPGPVTLCRDSGLSTARGVFQAFKSSEEVRERLIRAYELMLGFYGIQLEDRDTGAVRRAQNYHKRFQNLNW